MTVVAPISTTRQTDCVIARRRARGGSEGIRVTKVALIRQASKHSTRVTLSTLYETMSPRKAEAGLIVQKGTG